MTNPTSTKDGMKPQVRNSKQNNINLSPKPNEKKAERKTQAKPINRIDIDSTLVGKKVVIHVQMGNVVKFIIGTITAMGPFWVIVRVEKTDVPFIQDIAYVNKAYIIAYSPLPSETGQGEQK